MIDLNWKYTITAKRTYKAIRDGWPIIVNTGGARSGKTYGTMQNLCLLALERPGIRISCVSRSLPHIKKGAFRDFQVLLRQGIHAVGEMRWTDFTFHFHNGSYIEFFGLEDPEKAHGPGRDIMFINEANYVPHSVYTQLAMRTTGQIILDLNPSEFNCWVYEVADNPANINIHSTYKDNIENLSPQQVAFIEAYKELQDQFMWQVYGLGLRGASEEIIFRNWSIYDVDPPDADVAFGLDFGFVHPAAMVKVIFYEGGCYIRQMIYKPSLTMTELANEVLAINPGTWPIYCDAAEPKSIEELYRQGCNVHPADKDDVWATIMKMKSVNLFIHRDSVDYVKEIQGYKWKKDKNDNILEEPNKAAGKDDLIDATRYCIFTHLNNSYVSV